jgi:hypothetical protein
MRTCADVRATNGGPALHNAVTSGERLPGLT